MKTMDDLREMLFGTIADLRAGKCDAATAKTVAELGQSIINTAKAEADFARATGRSVASGLIPQTDSPANITRIPTATGEKQIDGHITRHTLK
jgi:hypothetical protein